MQPSICPQPLPRESRSSGRSWQEGQCCPRGATRRQQRPLRLPPVRCRPFLLLGCRCRAASIPKLWAGGSHQPFSKHWLPGMQAARRQAAPGPPPWQHPRGSTHRGGGGLGHHVHAAGGHARGGLGGECLQQGISRARGEANAAGLRQATRALLRQPPALPPSLTLLAVERLCTAGAMATAAICSRAKQQARGRSDGTSTCHCSDPFWPHPPQTSSASPAAYHGCHGDQVWRQRRPALHLHPPHPRWVPSSAAVRCPGQPLDLSRKTAPRTLQSSWHRWTHGSGAGRRAAAAPHCTPALPRHPCRLAHWGRLTSKAGGISSPQHPMSMLSCITSINGTILTSAVIYCSLHGHAELRLSERHQKSHYKGVETSKGMGAVLTM
jgi:hypothetical protein